MVDLEQLGRIASEPVHYVAKAIRLGLLAFLGTTLLMWVVNALLDLRELNFAVLFLVAIAAFWIATSPKTLPAFIGMKVATPDLANRVQSVFISVVYNTMLVAAFLASWSFADKPSAFFPFAAGVLLLLMWQLYHNEKAGFAKGLQFWYIAGIIGLALSSTFGFNPVFWVQESIKEAKQKEDETTAEASLILPKEGTVVEFRPGMRLTLDLRNHPEGNLVSTLVRSRTGEKLAKFSDSDFVTPLPGIEGTIYYYKQGVLMATFEANEKGFAKAGVGEVEIAFYSSKK